MANRSLPERDEDVPGFVADLGIPGICDIHVHFMPMPLQRRVWEYFDRLAPPWPMAYRGDVGERLTALRNLGAVAHTALAYAHKPGMAAWLNRFTLDLAADQDPVVPTFTFYPDPDVDRYVAAALAEGGRCVKVHLQVGKFDANDRRLDGVWSELAALRVPVVLHAAAVPDGSGGEEFCGAHHVVRLLERFPDLLLVIAHLGAPEFGDFLRLAEDVPTVHLDTAMALTDPDFIGRLPDRYLDRFAALGDRIVFGSDFPSIPVRYVDQVQGVARLDVDDGWLRRVFWENPARLLRIDGRSP
ncbi:MAG: amidohydrolase family protein [Nitriliruptorales bacterium]